MDGEPCDLHGLTSALSRLTFNLAEQRQMDACPTCDGTGINDDGQRCTESDPGIIVDYDWNLCPYGMLATPWWHSMMRLDHARKVSPLAGWPDAYSFATVTAILALDTADKERSAKLQKRAARRARG
jgi:hypothetical protein